MQLHTLCI